MPTVSPTLRRRRLGLDVKGIREQAGLTHVALAKTIGTNQTLLSQVENAHEHLPEDLLEKLISELDVGATTADELRALHRDAELLGWWEKTGLVGKNVERLVGFEAGASQSRSYEDAYVPGLLQIRPYARAVIAAAEPYLTRSGNISQLTDYRMRRGERLQDGDFRLTAIMNEGALLRPVGGVQTMRAQLRHLIWAAGGDVEESELYQPPAERYPAEVEFLVLPLGAGAHPGMGQSLTILTFPDERDGETVFLDYAHASRFVEKQSEVRVHSQTWTTVLNQSLRVEESLARLVEIEQSYAAA